MPKLQTKDEIVADFSKLREVYSTAFSGVAGDEVMADLAKYTKALEVLRPENAWEQAFVEGMRAVFWRIYDYSKFTGEELFRWKARRVEEPPHG